MKKTSPLRQLLDEKLIIVAPGCYDALTAIVIEGAGSSAAYLWVYSVSAG